VTTRRKFGLGIAAIIAAQRAPAALIRSIVAGRHIAALKKDVPAQGIPYITPTNAKQGILVDACALAGNIYVIDFMMIPSLVDDPDYCSFFGARNYDENYEFGTGCSLFGIFNGQQTVVASRQGYTGEENTGIPLQVGNRYRITFAPTLTTVEDLTLATTRQFQYSTEESGNDNRLMVFSIADYDPFDPDALWPDFGSTLYNNPVMPMKLYGLKVYNSSNVLTHDYVPYNSGGVIGLRNALNGNVFANATEYGAIGDFAYGIDTA
jgi:hypothetical protein